MKYSLFTCPGSCCSLKKKLQAVGHELEGPDFPQKWPEDRHPGEPGRYRAVGTGPVLDPVHTMRSAMEQAAGDREHDQAMTAAPFEHGHAPIGSRCCKTSPWLSRLKMQSLLAFDKRQAGPTGLRSQQH